MASDISLVNQVRYLMSTGVYDPDELFRRIYTTNRAHYSKVRDAIHVAKGW